MAQSIRNIICTLNESLARVFKGAKFYGIATPATRENKTSPVVEEREVSFDDSFALQLYYKLGEISVSNKPGFGDNKHDWEALASRKGDIAKAYVANTILDYQRQLQDREAMNKLYGWIVERLSETSVMMMWQELTQASA